MLSQSLLGRLEQVRLQDCLWPLNTEPVNSWWFYFLLTSTLHFMQTPSFDLVCVHRLNSTTSTAVSSECWTVFFFGWRVGEIFRHRTLDMVRSLDKSPIANAEFYVRDFPEQNPNSAYGSSTPLPHNLTQADLSALFTGYYRWRRKKLAPAISYRTVRLTHKTRYSTRRWFGTRICCCCCCSLITPQLNTHFGA